MPEILISGIIGDDVRWSSVTAQLSSFEGQPVTVRINSEGGSVQEAIAIYNALKDYAGRVTTIVEGGAFSAASLIAMAGDDREIAENALMMVHGARCETSGDLAAHDQNSEALRAANRSLVKTYVEKMGRPESEIETMLTRDNWFDAEQALAAGLVTRIGPPGKIMAVDTGKFSTVPAELAARFMDKEETMSKEKATLAQLEAINKNEKFVVAQLKAEATVAEAQAAHTKAMEEENESLTSKVAAMEEEKEELQARIAAMDEEMEALRAKFSAMDEDKDPEAMEEEKPEAKSGVTAIGGLKGGERIVDYRDLWHTSINALVEKGKSRQEAARIVNRQNPGLRENMLASVNA